MKWVKAPQELVMLLDDAMKGVDCQRKPMFGYPSYFLNGYMFIGLFQDKLYARLSESQVSDARREYPQISTLEPMPGRPMRGYFVLPGSLYNQPKELKRFIKMSTEYTRSLPPKEPKARKK